MISGYVFIFVVALPLCYSRMEYFSLMIAILVMASWGASDTHDYSDISNAVICILTLSHILSDLCSYAPFNA
jgi:hypothetical protein